MNNTTELNKEYVILTDNNDKKLLDTDAKIMCGIVIAFYNFPKENGITIEQIYDFLIAESFAISLDKLKDVLQLMTWSGLASWREEKEHDKLISFKYSWVIRCDKDGSRGGKPYSLHAPLNMDNYEFSKEKVNEHS